MARVAVILAATLAAAGLSPTAAHADEIVGFTSPSGNIGCMLDSEMVRCDVRDRTWSPPPRPADCDSFMDYGQGIMMQAGDRARFVCAGDTALNGGPPLAYGDTITRGSIECRSEQSGISCWDFVYGNEFAISRDGYRLD